MTIQAGQLRHRVEVQVRSVTKTRGIVTETWATEMLIWAKVSPLAGRELERAREVVANATHQVQTRYRVGINTRKRLRHDNRILNIEAVQDVDERNRELILTCVEES